MRSRASDTTWRRRPAPSSARGTSSGGGAPAKRDRTLSDHEVRVFWQATAAMPYPWAPLARMLLLSGCRLGEVAHLSWAEVELDRSIATVPGTRMKTKLPHEIQFTPQMMAIVEGLPRFQDGRYLFSCDGSRSPVNQFSRFKDRLDAAMRAVDPEIPAFVLHDLRRTARSLMSRAGVTADIGERVLAHVVGGIRGVYDKHDYAAEKRRALEALGSLVERIVNPVNNVVPMTKVPA